jgi:hypothetical protein
VHAKENVMYQKALEEALVKAIETKTKCFDSMEDIKCYNQTLIDIKENILKCL